MTEDDVNRIQYKIIFTSSFLISVLFINSIEFHLKLRNNPCWINHTVSLSLFSCLILLSPFIQLTIDISFQSIPIHDSSLECFKLIWGKKVALVILFSVKPMP